MSIRGAGKTMAKAKYQFEDFLMNVNTDDKDFVANIHEMLLQGNYKAKIQVTKSNGFQLSYHQPKIKTVAGRILTFFFLEDELVVRLEGKHHKQYLNVSNAQPQRSVNQIKKAEDCIKFGDPEKCWKGCIGYEFDIGENHYQKCIIQCFQLKVDSPSMPYLLQLIECESKARGANPQYSSDDN